MAITKRQLREAARLFDILSSGMSDSEAADELGLSLEEFAAVKRRMFEYKSDEIGKLPVEHVFIEYLYHQLENIRDLTAILKLTSLDSRQSTASVSAVRAKADIWDKIFTRGQECGLIKKVAERSETLLGVVVANLSDQQLKSMMAKKFREIGKMVEDYGDGNLLELPAPTNLYQDEVGTTINIDSVKQSALDPLAGSPNKNKKKRKIKRVKVPHE